MVIKRGTGKSADHVGFAIIFSTGSGKRIAWWLGWSACNLSSLDVGPRCSILLANLKLEWFLKGRRGPPIMKIMKVLHQSCRVIHFQQKGRSGFGAAQRHLGRNGLGLDLGLPGLRGHGAMGSGPGYPLHVVCGLEHFCLHFLETIFHNLSSERWLKW